ncbi:MAG TPA: peptide-N4-asparagine amidase [Kribbella sp.]|uniref:peptide-N4-asparagine amidase n=1 Tax=Kribbella sp. TaxID=1871183 RepID=UPI002D766F74|nr:peptide-N4-asparagine amidase [Kribbella sp.]HET6292585.1 peptide-N4-asparagine amidase [Kribbella sp.]
MRTRPVALVSLSVLLLGWLTPAAAAPPPSEFGTDYDDPRTPAPAVTVPHTRHCSVEIVRNGFKNFDPYQSTYTPPAACRGPWSKVVLRMEGSVKGVQYDRLGHITIGGVGIFRTSTPEPSTDGISWKVEKDLSSYSPLLRSPQPVVMELGNVVDDTYTGVLDIVVTLDFYVTGFGAPAARTANAVLPLQDQTREDSDLVGTATLPRNTSRLLGEIYVTGSGGGCEEFWDTSAPASTGYSCPDGSPYREVEVLIDGKVAGIALPYPYIYTGGWSNPYSWRPSPAPRAFDIKPLTYDLTPFVGQLTDGKAHEYRIHVVGVPAGQSGWFTVPNLHVWTDPILKQTRGGITSYSVAPLTKSDEVTGSSGTAGSVLTKASRSLKLSGYVDTSAGRIRTTVERSLTNSSDHTWEAGETRDTLDASWKDVSTVTTGAKVERAELNYSKNGYISFLPSATAPGGYDVITDLELADKSHTSTRLGGLTLADRRTEETYDGRATWIYNVPRDQRHATGTQTVRYRTTGTGSCYDHTLTAVNGTYTKDYYRC